ncbi:zinc finger protein 83-like [Ctenocephalides felis]|uniref:zinc finger protein 83-like n=1 Tax=Ctenocephalides felis TaxID=7515 RepID=UPI000E6E4681|nr:zinc finger protein 83-like [Ctenocephalides felis]
MDVYKTFCRLCAGEDSSNIKIDNELKEYIQKYLRLYIQPSDLSPQFVCKICVEKLECFNSFASQCFKVQNFYDEIISRNVISEYELSLLKSEFKIINSKHYTSSDVTPLQEIKTILEDNKNLSGDLDYNTIIKTENESNSNDKFYSPPIEEKRKRGRPRRKQSKIGTQRISRKRLISHDFSSENSDGEHYTESDVVYTPDEDRIDNSYKENDQYENENNIDSETKFSQYKCAECEEIFNKKSHLAEHIKTHTSKEKYPYICYHCGSQHSTEVKLKRHEIAHIPQEERQIYPCPHCDKRFMKPQAVDVHIKSVHLQERPFVCHQCGRAFSSKGTLNEHLLIHTDVTPFVCDCGKRFKTIHRLKLHTDTHRDTQYECPVCFLQLNTKRTLRQHLVIHKEIRAYTCKICQKSFKRYKGLKTHEILHSGRRPYTCPFCDRTFTNGSNCRSHKRRMHPKELAEYEKALQNTNEDIGNQDSESKIIVNPGIAQGLHDQDANVNMAQDNNVSISDLSHSSIPKFTFEDIPRENITQEGNIS